PNSEVKRRSADGSVGSPHVRVGNCQALNKTRKPTQWVGFFAFDIFYSQFYPLTKEKSYFNC
ncbi:hypothetical protein KC979_16120, partial [Proteus mirabilis]|uniref:hypothetical protein n=3 Tax=Proteus mirabilis TaxID=584 RepID=UPI001B39A1B8